MTVPRHIDKACLCMNIAGCMLGMAIWTTACNHMTRENSLAGRLGGRKQVNKALHTCTSWYAYAAMFGRSTDMMVP